MDSHDERIQAIRDGFATVNEALAREAEALSDEVATRNPPDANAWNAAQIVHHVALTTGFLSGALSGAIEQVKVERPDDFREMMATMDFSDPIQTFDMLIPPDDASRDDAVARLRASAEGFSAAVDSLTPERCQSECVQLPFGVFSLYEIGEFTAAHVVRHQGQLRRTVGG